MYVGAISFAIITIKRAYHIWYIKINGRFPTTKLKDQADAFIQSIIEPASLLLGGISGRVGVGEASKKSFSKEINELNADKRNLLNLIDNLTEDIKNLKLEVKKLENKL